MVKVVTYVNVGPRHLRRVHNTTQGLALRRVSRALTLVATHWNARIDSDPISAFPCVAFMRLIKIF